ncbi:MAG: LysR family transcriptional regulator [Minicystis sp.]
MAKQSVSRHGLDDLQSMAVFARVVETRSFTAAARVLETTTSSVSKRIARLEERLNVPLIVRTTRAVSTTEAGLLFYERCERILREVDDAELAVTQLGATPRGTLRLSAPTILGEAHLASLITRFLEQYPDLRVDLDLSERPVNLVEEGYDLALRGLPLGALPDSSLTAKRLATVRGITCAAPSYLARRGVPRTLEDLAHHDCLHFTGIPLNKEWSFATPEGPRVVPVQCRVHTNNTSALRTAAISGAGILRTAMVAVSDAIQSGALQIVLDEYASVDFGLYAVYPRSKQALPKVKACLAFLAKELPPRLV